jgi:ribonuclease P protein component
MLPKHSRLTKETIERHLIRARRLKTSRFLVLYTRIPQSPRPQISFTVSKKVAPKAVVRNKLRRRGYAAAKPLFPRISTDATVLISYTSPDTKVSITELTIEIEQALVSVGLIK